MVMSSFIDKETGGGKQNTGWSSHSWEELEIILTLGFTQNQCSWLHTILPNRFYVQKNESESVSWSSHVKFFVTPWTVAHQAPLAMEFSRQEYCSGLPFLSPGDLLNPGSNLGLLHCRQILYHLSHKGSPTLLQLWNGFLTSTPLNISSVFLSPKGNFLGPCFISVLQENFLCKPLINFHLAIWVL